MLQELQPTVTEQHNSPTDQQITAAEAIRLLHSCWSPSSIKAANSCLIRLDSHRLKDCLPGTLRIGPNLPCDSVASSNVSSLPSTITVGPHFAIIANCDLPFTDSEAARTITYF